MSGEERASEFVIEGLEDLGPLTHDEAATVYLLRKEAINKAVREYADSLKARGILAGVAVQYVIGYREGLTKGLANRPLGDGHGADPAHKADWSGQSDPQPGDQPSCSCGYNGSPEECSTSRLTAQRNYVLEPLWELQEQAKSWTRGGGSAAIALSTVATRLDTLLTVATGGKWTHVVIQSLLERADECVRMRHDDLDRQYQLVLKHHVDYITRKEAPIAVQHEVILQHEEHLGMGDWYDELKVKPGQDLSRLLGPNYPDHRIVTRTTTIHETVDPQSAAGKTPAGDS